MRGIDFQEALEIEVAKLDDNLTKPTTLISEYFLNTALDKFWKTRYSENNFKRESFEQTQKRIDDLRTLVTQYLYTDEVVKVSNELYTVQLPSDYLILLGDTAGIAPADGMTLPCWEKDSNGKYVIKNTDTIEATIDTIDRIKENSLSEYHLHYAKARPIRLIQGDNIKLSTDGKYKVAQYLLTYLRKPIKIDLHTNPFAQYTDMPDHTHIEIVKLAAQMYIENQADPRYNTYTNETVSME